MTITHIHPPQGSEAARREAIARLLRRSLGELARRRAGEP